MKPITKKEMLSLHITGYIVLVFHAFFFSWFGTTGLYLLAIFNHLHIEAGSVLGHLFTGFLLLTLFPGQTFWTIRVLDRHQQERTVVGAPSDIENYYTKK